MKRKLNYININFKTKSYGGRELHWSESAIECYKRGCICEGCDIPHPTEDKCMMKSVVLDLSRRIESPEEYIRKQEEQQQKELDMINYCREAVSKGESIKSLANKYGYKETTFNCMLNHYGIYANNYKERDRR